MVFKSNSIKHFAIIIKYLLEIILVIFMRFVILCKYARKINKWKLVEPKNRIEKQNCCSFGTVPRMVLKYTPNRESHVLCISFFAIPWHMASEDLWKNIFNAFLFSENILQHHDWKQKSGINQQSDKKHMKI